MPQTQQNALLAKLSAADLALLAPYLEDVLLPTRHLVEEANEPITHAYFPTSGIISIVAKGTDGRQIEAGFIGREGMTALAVVMSNHRWPNDAFVQLAGKARRIPAEKLRDALAVSVSMRELFQRFAQVFMTQIAQTALANGRAKIEERLARWLLMARDRTDADDLELTHEVVALMLGVRRPGVTDALNELEGKGLVKSGRGVVRIVDRDGLLVVAGGSYGVPEAEYKRLLG